MVMMANFLRSKETSFLDHGGEIGKLIRGKDWSKHHLGDLKSWPQSLKTTLGLILNSRFPMLVFWGKELNCFYNDAFRPSLGIEGKHPSSLGEPAEQVWEEVWDTVKPLIKKVLEKKESTWKEDLLLPIYRNGAIEDVYWTFSYSPIIDENGDVGGVFITCMETTQEMINRKQLQENSNLLEFAIEATELATFDMDVHTGEMKVNKRFREWFGLKEGENINEEITNRLVVEEDREKVNVALAKAAIYEGGGFYDVQYTIIHPRSKERLVLHSKGKVRFGLDKKPSHFTATLQNVTETVHARQKVEESAKEFIDLANSLPEMTWTTDAEGNQTFASKRWKENFGVHLDNDFFEKYTHPKDYKKVMKHWSQCIKKGIPYKSEFRMADKQGDFKWYLSQGSPIIDGNQQIYKWVGSLTDINELKEAEERLKDALAKIEEREKIFSQLAELMPEKVSIANSSGKSYYFNKTWQDYLGKRVDELLMQDWGEIAHPDDLKKLQKKWKYSLKTGKDFEMEYRIRDKNDEYRWHLTRSTAIKSEDDNIRKWISVTTEIQKLKEDDERKSDFIKMVSHELKTPVTSIKGYVQLLLGMLEQEKENKMPNIPLKSSLERMDIQIKRLTRLITEMLDLSRLEESKLEIKKDLIDLNDLVKETVSDIHYASISHSIDIQHNYNGYILGDKDRINQVLINFITNGIKYSPNQSKIIITIDSERNNRISVAVTDFGIGISSKDLQNIFERFYRVSGKKEDIFSGLGIGLYISREIIAKHHGEIKVESKLGKGATFKFILPAKTMKENG